MRSVRNSFGWNIRETTRAESFVDNKENKQWIRLALDQKTREIVGIYIGSRRKESAQKLWDSLPSIYRGAYDALPPVNLLCPAQIFGLLIQTFYQPSGIKLLAKRVVRQTTLNALTIQCANEFLALVRKTLSNSCEARKSYWSYLVFYSPL